MKKQKNETNVVPIRRIDSDGNVMVFDSLADTNHYYYSVTK